MNPKTHCMSHTTIYNTWTHMRGRCNNPKNRQYHSYGGRGITVCERWHKFENFHEDMGPRPDGRTLDRINNNGNYEFDNCRWATLRQQNNNRINTALINGEPVTVVARRHGKSPDVLYQRYFVLGWTLEEALNTPVREKRCSKNQK